jgi:hypothetical protein
MICCAFPFPVSRILDCLEHGLPRLTDITSLVVVIVVASTDRENLEATAFYTDHGINQPILVLIYTYLCTLTLLFLICQQSGHGNNQQRYMIG